MNERIKQLALQAGFAYEPHKDQLWVSGSTEVMISPGLKKFAELIVGECADYIRSNYDSWDAEPLAFNMEKDFGLHGDYAE